MPQEDLCVVREGLKMKQNEDIRKETARQIFAEIENKLETWRDMKQFKVIDIGEIERLKIKFGAAELKLKDKKFLSYMTRVYRNP